MAKAQFVAKIGKSNQPWSVKRLHENRSILHFDLAIQRRGVWKVDQKSDLIHSLIYGYDIPKVYAQDKGDDQLWFLDGKQRITTILEFINESFKLASNTAPIPVVPKYVEDVLKKEMEARDIKWELTEGTVFDEENDEVEVVFVKIADLYFTTLPQDFQKEILDSKITITRVTGLSDEERDVMFQKLNSGTPLKAIELSRVYAGSDVMAFVNTISSVEFFAKTISISNVARNRFADEEIILQTIALVEKNLSNKADDVEGVELGGVAIRDFAIAKKEKGLSDEVKDILTNVTKYLNEAFPATEHFLKKVHIPMLFMLAWKRAMPEGMEAKKFGGWAQQFFAPMQSRSKLEKTKNQRNYSRATEGGSAKVGNVNSRLDAIFKEFDGTFEDAPDYKMPEPKVTTAKLNTTNEAGASAGQNEAAATSESKSEGNADGEDTVVTAKLEDKTDKQAGETSEVTA